MKERAARRAWPCCPRTRRCGAIYLPCRCTATQSEGYHTCSKLQLKEAAAVAACLARQQRACNVCCARDRSATPRLASRLAPSNPKRRLHVTSSRLHPKRRSLTLRCRSAILAALSSPKAPGSVNLHPDFSGEPLPHSSLRWTRRPQARAQKFPCAGAADSIAGLKGLRTAAILVGDRAHHPTGGEDKASGHIYYGIPINYVDTSKVWNDNRGRRHCDGRLVTPGAGLRRKRAAPLGHAWPRP